MRDLNQRTRQIIAGISYITIASVSVDGKPWNTPVFSAYDQDFNFYWGSHRGSQHSKNINENSNIFLVIYDSTVEAGAGEAVYIEASAIELADPAEIKIAHKLLQDRHAVPYWKLNEFKPDT